ncbi:uncharacterized protein LOC133318293 [Gastrolobium bilobum]|uniref:uncharacterized protein LOC133318293 n=1 Tax=Gastrolobium bilobum TaxID=150636 RepID=UPI002AB0C1DC|nr:uncharacterized protein LOC133318293 [Gastrolobium bilobum]
MWKIRTRSPSMEKHHHHAQLTKAAFPSSGSGFFSEEKELSVSARKLAATLWEINDLPKSMIKKEPMRSCKDMIGNREKALRSSLLGQHISDPLNSPFSERMKGFEDDSRKRSTANLEEVGNQQRNKKNCGKCRVRVKNHLKEARSGLSTSKKILKVLKEMCLQEQHSSSIPLILAVSSELDRVRNQIDQLIQDQSSNKDDIKCLMKHFAQEKNAWKRREREKVHHAITSTAQELEVEKQLRRQTERLNKKIAKEMANAKASNSKMSKELEREKRAKEILEQICDELAKGIGEGRAQIEELQRESAKVREEVEKEREMHQLADVLREERVHMKLSEAKYQFEEKNAVLENMRNELESFFGTKEGENCDVNPEFKKLKDLESYLNKTCWELQNIEKVNDLDVGDGVENEDDSADSDLQSIELNMVNDNRACKWSRAWENVAQDDRKRVSIDKDIGRKSFSERIQWGSICFNKGSTSGKRDFGIYIQESSDKFDGEGSIEFHFGAQIQEDNEESESYRPIMSLQDHIS